MRILLLTVLFLLPVAAMAVPAALPASAVDSLGPVEIAHKFDEEEARQQALELGRERVLKYLADKGLICQPSREVLLALGVLQVEKVQQVTQVDEILYRATVRI